MVDRSNTDIFTKFCYLKLIIHIIKKYDIDLIQAQDYFALYPAYMAASITGRPILFVKAGGEIPDYVIPDNVHVAVFSRELEDGMKRAGYEHPLHCIPHRIDLGTYYKKKVPQNFLDQYCGLPEGGIKIAMAMRFDNQKKKWLFSLLKEIKQHGIKDLFFIIAGDGPLFGQIKKQSDLINQSLPNKIIFLTGQITQTRDMVGLFNYADLVVGHGRGILEAMACGKPVINLGETGISTVVDSETVDKVSYYNFSGRHLRFYPDMGAPLIENILALSGDGKRCTELRRFSLNYIKKCYDSKKAADKYLSAYESLTKEKRNYLKNLTLFFTKRIVFITHKRLSK